MAHHAVPRPRDAGGDRGPGQQRRLRRGPRRLARRVAPLLRPGRRRGRRPPRARLDRRSHHSAALRVLCSHSVLVECHAQRSGQRRPRRRDARPAGGNYACRRLRTGAVVSPGSRLQGPRGLRLLVQPGRPRRRGIALLRRIRTGCAGHTARAHRQRRSVPAVEVGLPRDRRAARGRQPEAHPGGRLDQGTGGLDGHRCRGSGAWRLTRPTRRRREELRHGADGSARSRRRCDSGPRFAPRSEAIDP